jgi:hypothetical protein
MQKYKDEDLFVTILSESKVLVLYRFYGLRHSYINLGYKIDFETESVINLNLSRLRKVIHLGDKWNLNIKKMLIWQQFIKLLYKHLKDIEEIDMFYFNLLQELSIKLYKQDAKRVLIDGYLKLLDFEGRLHLEDICFVCEEKINDDYALNRAFLPSHTKCTFANHFDKNEAMYMLKNKLTIFLDDKKIDYLWNIMQEGL